MRKARRTLRDGKNGRYGALRVRRVRLKSALGKSQFLKRFPGQSMGNGSQFHLSEFVDAFLNSEPMIKTSRRQQ